MARDNMQWAMGIVNNRHPYQDESDFANIIAIYCNNIAKSEACAYGAKFLVRNFAIRCNCKVIANDFAITLQLK